MKHLVFFLTAILSSSAFAQTPGQPFRLDEGKYDTECWFATVYRTGNGELRRRSGYEKGTLTSVIRGDVAMEIVQLQGDNGPTKTYTKVITTPLGEGLYKQASEIETNEQVGRQAQPTIVRYETNIKVDNNFSQNVKVRKADDDYDKPGFGESIWQRLSDGRIVFQSYLREKTWYEVGREDRERLVANTLCVYSLEKQPQSDAVTKTINDLVARALGVARQFASQSK